MDLILWRHADAEDVGSQGDAARNLTKKGRKQAERIAEWLRPRLEGDWRILCSPAARAGPRIIWATSLAVGGSRSYCPAPSLSATSVGSSAVRG